AFALGPNATDDWTKPLAWVDHALDRLAAADAARPDKQDETRRVRHMFLNTRGAVLFRAGRFEEAAKVLRDGMSLHPDGGEFHDRLFLALAEHRLGHAGADGQAAAKTQASHGVQAPRGLGQGRGRAADRGAGRRTAPGARVIAGGIETPKVECVARVGCKEPLPNSLPSAPM